MRTILKLVGCLMIVFVVGVLWTGINDREPVEAETVAQTAPSVPKPEELAAYQEQVIAFNQITHECSLLFDYYHDSDIFPPRDIPDYPAWNLRISKAIDSDYYKRRHAEVESELSQRLGLTPDELTQIYFRGIEGSWITPSDQTFNQEQARANAEAFVNSFAP